LLSEGSEKGREVRLTAMIDLGGEKGRKGGGEGSSSRHTRRRGCSLNFPAGNCTTFEGETFHLKPFEKREKGGPWQSRFYAQGRGEARTLGKHVPCPIEEGKEGKRGNRVLIPLASRRGKLGKSHSDLSWGREGGEGVRLFAGLRGGGKLHRTTAGEGEEKGVGFGIPGPSRGKEKKNALPAMMPIATGRGRVPSGEGCLPMKRGGGRASTIFDEGQGFLSLTRKGEGKGGEGKPMFFAKFSYRLLHGREKGLGRSPSLCNEKEEGKRHGDDASCAKRKESILISSS